MNQPASAYFIEDRHEPNETHTLSVLVQNEPPPLHFEVGDYGLASRPPAAIEPNQEK